jgi:ribonucleoside-diphosphate reductase alpha chain/ribonucleoside-diphosphate reductase subunit M1
MLYKDACNKKSNQKNLGTIKSSNLCTEIIEYSDEDESAVCNLASIGLSKFIKKNTYDFSTIVIYTKTTCDYCKLAKAHLTDFDVIKTANYQEINMDNDALRQQMYKDINEKYSIEVNSVPQIIIDGKHIGGYEDLLELMAYEVDYEKLHSITKIITDNLNKVIDVNFYPTEKTKRSNLRHRPIGIGVQGLADLFALMKIPFHSEKAIKLNKDIFETIYHAALEKSNELATERITDMTLIKNIVDEIGMNKFIEHDKPHELIKGISSTGVINTETLAILNNMIIDNRPIKDELDRLSDDHLGAYATFNGSPASEGILQFDMWDVVPSDRYDWLGLKGKIVKTGLRNSLLLAPMPTASTSQILGNNECFEPFTSNIYVRRTIAGEFVLVNKHLMKELAFLNLWTEEVKNQIIVDKGSIQKIKKIPKILRDRFKIVWEIPMKHILNMARDRGAFIDQSQSTNLWMENPTYKKLTAMHFYAWSLGLKTGLYYLRTKAKATPQQFTIDPNLKTMEEEDICESCSG